MFWECQGVYVNSRRKTSSKPRYFHHQNNQHVILNPTQNVKIAMNQATTVEIVLKRVL